MAGALLAAFAAPGGAGPAAGADYTPVTDARLANPEPANWLMTRGNYMGWSYSALDRINTGNVKNLALVWSFSTGVDSGHESPPIVNNGVMSCHGSVFDPRDGAEVLDGPAPRRLPSLGVKIADGAVIVASTFSGRVGGTQG